MTDTPTFKLGRQPRAHMTAVPHLSSFLAEVYLSPPPLLVNYITNMPHDFGVMLNDQLGDCTIAAYYHARQVWTWNTRQNHQELTEPNACVLKLYELSCGYNPRDPRTDQGGVEQHVLAYIQNHGAPIGAAHNNMVHRLTAFFEVDPRNTDDIRRVIYECGVCYIGFDMPSNVLPRHGNPPPVWTIQPGSHSLGGHAVVLVGYDQTTFTCISWGLTYKMSVDFFTNYTDEAYAICDPSWIAATGRTPLGMTVAQLEEQMAAIRALV